MELVVANLNMCEMILCCNTRGRSVLHKKTAVTTFRLSQEALESLQKEASEQKTSVNTLVNQIIAKHMEWDTFAQKYGFVSIPQDFYTGIISTTDEALLSKAAIEAGKQLREYLLFSFGRATPATLVEALGFAGKYAGLGSIEMKCVGPRCHLAVHHSLGRKHSIYLKTMLDTAISVVFGHRPTSEIADGLVAMEFNLPPQHEIEPFTQKQDEMRYV